MTTLTKPSYAKVNLFLDILRLREDQYHDLCMVNAKISLHDTITCSLNNAGKINLTSNVNDIPLDENNTACKAANRFMKHAGLALGFDIHLEKSIPHGAGLGGGSSNAAVVLQCLDELTAHPLSHQQLCDLGVSIGADVPFFLYDRACHIEGIGESISPLEYDTAQSTSPYVVLLSPKVMVPTGKAYRLWDQSEQQKHSKPDELISCIIHHRFDDMYTHLFNSFEPVIYSAFPQIGQAYHDFCEVSSTRPILSGSGSNLFALVLDEGEANHIAAILNKRGYEARVCRLLL